MPRYTYTCEEHGDFTISKSFEEDVPKLAWCPVCAADSTRSFRADLTPVIYNADGFSNGYFNKNPGRGQSWDKRENLNTNWSKHYGESPPPADSKGTYDGT